MKQAIKKIEDKIKSMPTSTIKEKLLKDIEDKKLKTITKWIT